MCMRPIQCYCILFALMTALHTLGILSTSFDWIAFPIVLKELLSTCWLLFLHSTVQLIPNHLNLVEFCGLWRPGHLIQHFIPLFPGQLALTQPGGVLGHCPVENQMIVPRSANQMGGVTLQNAEKAMLIT